MDKSDYCYRLNLPDIKDVTLSLDDICQLVPEDFRGSKIFYPDPKSIFKQEWLEYKNISWDYTSLFIRTGKEQSVLHRDNPHSSNSLHWGINWVYGEDSVMEYWEDEKIKHQKIIYDSGGKTTVFLETDLEPSKSYTMTSGAYLVNASVPHRVTNLSSTCRIALSLRSKKFRYDNPGLKWKDIISIFESEIV